MSRRTNLINNILAILFTVGAIFAVTQVCNARYTGEGFGKIIGLLLAGAIIDGFICTLAHELGHLVSGKKNGFVLTSFSVWFFMWHKVGKKTVFDFTLPIEAAGHTEMTPVSTENLSVRLKKMTACALWCTFFVMLIGIVPLCIASLPLWAYALTAMFLPTGAGTFFYNALPISTDGVKNDGALVYSLKKNDDTAKVVTALLSVQAELYAGKTPSEIDEKYYFDVPQLSEDDMNFALLLNARYNYYLDKGDYENVKKTTERLLSIEEYLPKSVASVIKADALYNACTFDFNEERADDLTYELEKYLNSVNTATTVRVKAAYLFYVKKDYSAIENFYKKGLRETKRTLLSGYGKFERALLDKIKADYDSTIENDGQSI